MAKYLPMLLLGGLHVEMARRWSMEEKAAVERQRNRFLQTMKVKKVVFMAQYPVVGPLKALYTSLPDRPVHSDTNSASPGTSLAMQQLSATTKSLTCPPLSIARYSFIQQSTGAPMERTKMPNLRNGSKGGFEPGLT